MCASSSPIKDDFIYERRRMQKNTVALLSSRNVAEITRKNNLFDCAIPLKSLEMFKSSNEVCIYVLKWHGLLGESRMNSASVSPENLGSVEPVFYPCKICSIAENALIMLICDCCEEAFHLSCCMPEIKKLPKDQWYCQSCFTKKRTSRRNIAGVSPKSPGSVEPAFSLCKICSIPENALIMLICDCCEDAFHLSCCIPEIKKLPKDHWYCQSCLTKRKPLLRNIVGSSTCISDNTSEIGGPISFMLRDIGPHRSRARIGEDFQVEVPNYSDPISNDDDYFGKPKEMDHVDCCSLEGWNRSKMSKPSSTSNWLQCKDEDDEGNICGKWRRAPLFSVQTDDWDCSCALRWDLIHADCFVHQELDTDEVLKQLKYVEMFKSRLSKKMRPV